MNNFRDIWCDLQLVINPAAGRYCLPGPQLLSQPHSLTGLLEVADENSRSDASNKHLSNLDMQTVLRLVINQQQVAITFRVWSANTFAATMASLAIDTADESNCTVHSYTKWTKLTRHPDTVYCDQL